VAELTSTETADGLHLQVKGEVDIVGVDDLRAQLPPEATDGADVLLDLSEVTLLDSTGLAGLLALARDVHQGGGRLETITPHGSEGRLVIDMAGVGELLGLREAGPRG
jgi:anti-sigma B factor antagonist